MPPVFAAAFALHSSWNAFLVGLAASVGAGVSMGFADDGKLSGRGTPFLRGLVCGLLTIAGGIGHACDSHSSILMNISSACSAVPPAC